MVATDGHDSSRKSRVIYMLERVFQGLRFQNESSQPSKLVIVIVMVVKKKKLKQKTTSALRAGNRDCDGGGKKTKTN